MAHGWKTAKLEIPASAEIPLPCADPPFEEELEALEQCGPRGGGALEGV